MFAREYGIRPWEIDDLTYAEIEDLQDTWNAGGE